MYRIRPIGPIVSPGPGHAESNYSERTLAAC